MRVSILRGVAPSRPCSNVSVYEQHELELEGSGGEEYTKLGGRGGGHDPRTLYAYMKFSK